MRVSHHPNCNALQNNSGCTCKYDPLATAARAGVVHYETTLAALLRDAYDAGSRECAAELAEHT